MLRVSQCKRENRAGRLRRDWGGLRMRQSRPGEGFCGDACSGYIAEAALYAGVPDAFIQSASPQRRTGKTDERFFL